MPRRPKCTGAPVPVRAIQFREIPPWIKKVPVPPGEDLLELLNDAWSHPGLIYEGPYAPFFVDLAKRGAEEAERCPDTQSRHKLALKTLDLVPGFLLQLDADWSAWLRDVLFDVFQQRLYKLVAGIPVGRGRPKSDEYVAALLRAARDAPPRDFGKEKMSSRDAVAAVAAMRNITPSAVWNAQSRARAADREREKRIREIVWTVPATKRQQWRPTKRKK